CVLDPSGYGLGDGPAGFGVDALAGALRAGRRERAVAVVSGGNTPAGLHALLRPRTATPTETTVEAPTATTIEEYTP
ncbi:hypothetical protein ABZ590_40455, partial [Streptomyces hirsutus]